MTSINPHLSYAVHSVQLEGPHFESLCWRLSSKNGETFLQVKDNSLSANISTGRKWHISPHATLSEIYQTMLLALIAWWEHEIREAFTIEGTRPFGPHISTEALIKISSDLDVRNPV